MFGNLAYSVQLRVRDFGVRRALGATTSDVLRLVVGDAARVVVTGALIGLALSTLAGRLLTTVLFGVRPLDTVTFASVPIVLALTAAMSMAGPAWRAARIDPAIARRSQWRARAVGGYPRVGLLPAGVARKWSGSRRLCSSL